jgi:hypothetical protein
MTVRKVGIIVVDVPSELSLTPPQEKKKERRSGLTSYRTMEPELLQLTSVFLQTVLHSIKWKQEGKLRQELNNTL